MTEKLITYPLADAMSDCEHLHMAPCFDGNSASLVASTLPVGIEPSAINSLVPSNIEQVTEYASEGKGPLAVLEFDRAGQKGILVVHGDLSANLAMTAKETGTDLILSCPLRVQPHSLNETHRETLLREASQWAEKSLSIPAARWAGPGSTPKGLKAPWCDCDTAEQPGEARATTDSLYRMAALAYAATPFHIPQIKSSKITVCIDGRKMMPDGSISHPTVRFLAETSEFNKFEEISCPEFCDLVQAAIRKLPGQKFMIAQEWDWMSNDDARTRILPSSLVLWAHDSPPILTAHETIGAEQLLKEAAGLS